MAELISGDSTQEVAGIPLDNAAASRRRQRSLRLAVVTSLLSKGANVLIMFMALPMAYHLLGKERAAVYGVIQSVMWLVALSDLGIGPGISRRVAECAAMADRAGMKRVISTGLVMIMGLTGVFVGISCVTLSVVPVTVIFGENYAPHAAEMTQAAWLGLFCFAALVILYQLERIREGLQEVHVTNFLC